MPQYRYWKSEVPNSTWHLVDWGPGTLNQIVAEGAMFVTTYVSDAPPMAASDEETDLLENAVKRFGPLYFDLDAKDEEETALAEVRRLVFNVLPGFGIPTSVLRIWNSGGKGYHVMVPEIAFGGERGSRVLPWIHRTMFKEVRAQLEQDTGKKAHLDESLYPMGKGKMFRLAGVQRSNGRFKVPLKVSELHPETGLSLEQIAALTQKRRNLPYEIPAEFTPDPRALQWWQRGVDKAAAKLIEKTRILSVPLNEQQAEDLARNLPPCLRQTMRMTDYAGLEKLNFNAICAYILVPYFRNAGRTLEEAEEILDDFFANFTGSASYDTLDQRIEHFRGSWRDARRYSWKCGIVSSLLQFNCQECSVHLLEAANAFATSVCIEGEDDSAEDFKFEGPAWVPFTQFEQMLEQGKKQSSFAYRASQIDPDLIPPRDWIIRNRFVPKFCTVTVAPGGGSKSTLSTLEALAVVTGKELTGMKVLRRGGVLLYNAEDPADEMRRKVAALCIRHGIDFSALRDLFYRSGQDDEAFIFAKRDPEQGLMVNRLCVEKLVYFIRKHNILLLVLDPFVRTHRVNENDNMEIDAVIATMSRVANATGCAIHIVHHTRKRSSEGGVGDMDTARGASANVSAARVAHTINVMTEKEAKDWGVAKERAAYYVRLDDAKANFTAPGRGTVWFEREEVQLASQDRVGVLSHVKLTKATDSELPGTNEIKDVISRMVRPGHRVNLTSVADAAAEDGSVFFILSGKETSKPLSRTTMRRKVKAILEEGFVSDGYYYCFSSESAGQRVREYAVCEEAPGDDDAA